MKASSAHFETILIHPSRKRGPAEGREVLRQSAFLSAALLQSEQLENGFWGRSIERYLRLHNAQDTLGRSRADAKFGSLTHSAHALRGLVLSGVRPFDVDGLWRSLQGCCEPDGHIYPMSPSGPVITNLGEKTHTLAAARHSASGIVTALFCHRLLQSRSTHALEISRKAACLLVRHKKDLIRSDQEPGYSHAYVLESLCYCNGAGLLSKDLASLAVAMAKHLTGGKAQEAGLWSSSPTADLSNVYFGSVIAERLLWALHSGTVKRSSDVSARAEKSVHSFLTRIREDYTDSRTGGVYLDSKREIVDYGTTARCAKIALGLGRPDLIPKWWSFVTNSCRPLTDSNAHTQTWEAALLLFLAVQREQGACWIRESLAKFYQSRLPVARRLKSLVGITDWQTKWSFTNLWANPTTEKFLDSVSPAAPSVNMSGQPGRIRTAVSVDLKGFGRISGELREHFSEDQSGEIASQFHHHIQSFVNDGLEVAGVRHQCDLRKDTGDGAILAFGQPEIAHRFAVAVHNSSRRHNRKKTYRSARREFRIGMATGPTNGAESDPASHDTIITQAKRLEAKARVGEIVADTATHAGLPHRLQLKYGPVEWIPGKRGEPKISARRCMVAVPRSSERSVSVT